MFGVNGNAPAGALAEQSVSSGADSSLCFAHSRRSPLVQYRQSTVSGEKFHIHS